MSSLDRAKAILYPYQKAYIADKSKFSIFVASRQIGKTFGAAFKAAVGAISGENYIIMSTSMRRARGIMRVVKRAIEVSEIIVGEKIKLEIDNKDEIVIAGGGSILSVASNPATAVGESGHLIIDEASRFKNSAQIMDAVTPFITRGKLTLSLISTPLGKQGMFWNAYQKALNGQNWKLFKLDVYEAIKQGCPIDIDLLRAEMDEISFRQNYMCEFIDDLASFFSFELILSCTNDELENYSLEKLKRCEGLLIAGYDPGKIVDSGVFTILERDRLTSKIRVVHIKEFKQIDYSEQIAYIVQYCKTLKISRLFVDATGAGVPIHETLVRSLGSAAQPITYTNAIKEQLVTDFKLAMEKGEIEFPDDARLIDQLHGIRRDVNEKSGTVRYGHEEGKHDDIVLSICNAYSGFAKNRKINLDGIFTKSLTSASATDLF